MALVQEMEAALDIAAEMNVTTFVSVPAAIVEKQRALLYAYKNILDDSYPLPDTPCEVRDVPPAPYMERCVPIADLRPGDLKDPKKLDKKLRFMEFKGPVTHVAKQTFIFERPVLVRKHEHFGFVKQLTFIAHVQMQERDFDPMLFDAINCTYFGVQHALQGRQWVSAFNNDGLENLYLIHAPTAPTSCAFMHTFGRRGRGVWRTMSCTYDKQLAPIEIQYVHPIDGSLVKTTVLVRVNEMSDTILDEKLSGRGTYTYCNVAGLDPAGLPGIDSDKPVTSLTVECNSKKILAFSTAPSLSAGFNPVVPCEAPRRKVP
jgi:hypothetical protein